MASVPGMETGLPGNLPFNFIITSWVGMPGTRGRGGGGERVGAGGTEEAKIKNQTGQKGESEGTQDEKAANRSGNRGVGRKTVEKETKERWEEGEMGSTFHMLPALLLTQPLRC